VVQPREIAISLFLAGILAAIPSVVSPTIALQIFQIAAGFTSAIFFYIGTIAPRRWKPNFDLATKVIEIPLGFGLSSQQIVPREVHGKVLQIEVTNSIKSRVNASHCRAKLSIDGITSGEEFIPWRYIEIASGRGSGWMQLHDLPILRGDSGLLAICWTECGMQKGFVQTSSPQIQWSPYHLTLGITYKCRLTIFGDFKPSLYEFSFTIQSENAIQFTFPKKL